MRSIRVAKPLMVGLALALAVGCSKKRQEQEGGQGSGNQDLSGAKVIRIDGSSTVFPITQAVSEEFGRSNRARVMVGVSGTGGGFKKFCRDEISITGASRPIKATERQMCRSSGVEFIELPVAYDGLAVVVHPSAKWVDHLTVAELKRIWAPEAQGKVTSWDQVRTGFPDKRLTLFGPGVDSGTYDYFTKAIVGKEHASRGDFTSSEDDNVLVKGVTTDTGALAFFGYAYYAENKGRLKIVPIDDGSDENGKGAIIPSPETVANGTYQPLSRPIFIYVNKKDAGRAGIEAFVKYYLDEGRKLVSQVGYIPLPDKAYELVSARFSARKTGSLFEGGSKVGVTIEELLAKEGS